MSTGSRVATVCVLLLAVAAAGPAPAGGTTGAPTPWVPAEGASNPGIPADRAQGFAVGSPPPTLQEGANNSTVQHENPEEASGDGDLDGLESHLAGVLADRLGRSTVEISEGEYERGRDLLGDDYPETLGKYVDVAGETTGDGSGDAFESAARNQRSLAESLREYEETREGYEAAREDGNEAEARERARELVELNGEITNDGGNLTAAYGDIENGTGVNTDDETAIVEEAVRNNTETTEVVLRDTFERTELTVTRVSDPGPVSFADPLRIGGRLTTGNGSAVANETVRIRVGERGYTVDTDGDGGFVLTYAPVRLPVGERDLTVRYRPGPATGYLGSNATLPVDVEATNASLSAAGPNATAFGETVTVRGELLANGTGVPSAPVRITLGGRALGTATTDADGRYSLTTRLPAAVPNGSQPLVADVPLSDRAIAASASESAVTVEETATTLDLNASAADRGTVRLAGRLTTADGAPVPDRSVAVRLDGTTVSTVHTGPNGAFRAEVAVPGSADPGANVTVVAGFGGDGTNLAPSSARTLVVLPAGGGTTGDTSGGPFGAGDRIGLDSPLRLAAALAVLLALAAVGIAAWRRRRGPASRGAARTGSARGPTGTDEGGPGGADGRPGDAVLGLARETFDRGEAGAAVELAFAAIRRRLGERFDVDPGATHREFVEACVAAGTVDADALAEASRLYERAAFGAGAVPTDAAETALSLARSILDADGASERPAAGEQPGSVGGSPGGDD